MRLVKLAAATLLLALAGPGAWAGGPRWVTGSPYFQNNDGVPIVWYTQQPQYFTDPGDLSASVNHAAADALVAAAAAPWNVSYSGLVLAQGGALAEHLSSANVYLGPSGPVFPADVQASNSAAKQIAVIYDTDGSVTDTLLGGGASDPGNCRQSAVTETVDSINPAGQILHALIILNGRCTGPAPELQMEMEYRLIRAFGRVLGFGWSQANENVFTGTPQATYAQAMHWPLMHPIDVLCGVYVYQCLPQPFTLRPDDLSSLASLYPVYTVGGGKTATFTNATYIYGTINFSNGEGMQGVNVVERAYHQQPAYMDTYDVVSGVSGFRFQRFGGNPVTPKGSTLTESYGSPNDKQGYYSLSWIPVGADDFWDDFTVSTQAINPLYTGQYAVGPYQGAQVTPSGPAFSAYDGFIGSFNYGIQNFVATSGAGPCTAADGQESSPAAIDPSGFWTDTLCGYGYTAWSSLPVKAGRSLTVEITALDEQGYATVGKMQPVIGLWDSTDATGTLPTIASQASAMNASSLGMTNLMAGTSTDRTLRLGLGDMRGDGRPDFSYKARILYADSINPTSLPANGGLVTITGTGFRLGNVVTIGGAAATVQSVTANTIVALAPAITGPVAADVVVTDLSTGGTTSMSGALSYSQTAVANILTLVSAPQDGSPAGSAANPAFVVQAFLGDGVTPAPGLSLTLTASNATFGGCGGAATCVLQTDGSARISTLVTPLAAGAATLHAAAGMATVSASFNAAPPTIDILHVTSLPSGLVYASLPATVPFGVQVMLADGVTPAAGAQVAIAAVNAVLAGCSGLSACSLVADPAGTVQTLLTPSAAGLVSLQASAGGGMVSASFGALALPHDVLLITAQPAAGSYAGLAAATPFRVAVLYGDGTTPAAGASVTLTVTNGALGACGASVCTLPADSLGTVSSAVTPTTAGPVALTATAGGGLAGVTFTAAAIPPDVLHVLSLPANGSYAGSAASLPFTVQVLAGAGGAPATGIAVTVSASNATFGACGGASSCLLTADGSGSLSTTVTPLSAGIVALHAAAGGGSVSPTFQAAAVPIDILHVLSQPAGIVFAGVTAATPWVVQVMLPDGITPAASTPVTLAATGANLNRCGGSGCAVITDALGFVTTPVRPLAAGFVSLRATAGGGTAVSTFSAVTLPADQLHITSAPSGNIVTGRAAALPFTVQVLLGDGINPAAGVAVTLYSDRSSLAVCGGMTCVVTADANGIITTALTPFATGPMTLKATAGGVSVSTSFNGVSTPLDILHLVSTPANGSPVGSAAVVPFAVQVFLSDGVTPASGVAVTVTATRAAVAACGTPSCVLAANAAGTISTAVTPTSSGTVSLTASAAGASLSVSFSAVSLPPVIRTLTFARPTEFVAPGAAVPWTPTVSLLQNGLPATGAAITWTAHAGITLSAASSTTGTGGAASLNVVVGPLLSGQTAGGQACVAGLVCAAFGAQVVDPPAWLVVPVSGADQRIASTGTLQPLVLRAVDAAGHWLGGVPVQVHQAVDAWVVCPPSGRCPIAPVLRSASTTFVSDADGLLTIPPLQVTGIAEVTQIVAAAGPNGYLAVSLSKTP